MLNTEDKFLEFLYEADSISTFLTNYANYLSNSPNYIDKLHATKIHEYINTVYNTSFLKKWRTLFNSIYVLIEKSHPNVNFCIDGRRKSIFSFEKKIRKCISNSKSFDLKDLLAFRITLFGKDSLKAINNCYSVANTIIDFLIERGVILCECDPLRDISTCDVFNNITTPKQSGIKPEYQNYVKDYVFTPKTNGYQSLHIRVRDTKGRFIELQIRTFQMHLYAQNGDASHTTYKSKTYVSEPFNLLDVNKLKIDGIGMSGDELIDKVGLIKPLQILNRYKTFES